MASVTFERKDITTVTNGVVVHGCNCQGVMGSGVALAVRNKWPTVYTQYLNVVRNWSTEEFGPLLGYAQVIKVYEDLLIGDKWSSLFVVNAFTQQHYGKDGRKYASIEAIEKSLRYTMQECYQLELPLYMPLIGCGLGGLTQAEVMPVVQQLSQECDVDVIVCTV